MLSLRRNSIITVAVLCLIMFAFTGCQSTDKADNRYISVSGTGTVAVKPDTASFSITVENIKDTTEEARNATAGMVADAVAVLKDEFGLTDSEFATDYMSINPYYSWIDGERTLKGQKATQSLTVTLRNGIDKAGRVYDRLSEVDGISISSISYSKFDTSEELAEARRMASEDARKKAEDYAKGAGAEIGRITSLAEGSGNYYAVNTMVNSKLMLAASDNSYTPTTYYEGDLSVSASVTAVFEIL